MMRRKIITLCLLCGTLILGAQRINPITQATLDAYADILKANPNDYQTLYQRAAQYYRLSMYDNALADISKALTATPDKEKDYKAREYALLADVLTQQNEYARALEAVEGALAFNPGDYALLYQKGNLCLHLGNVAAARNAYSTMQRIKSRSQEALVGLARCDIMENKYDDAREKMTHAEELNSINPVTYSRIGDLYAEMHENREAALKYITAFALSDGDDNRGVVSLYKLAENDYPAVASAMNYAVEKGGNSLPLLLLKGNIASHTGHYEDAYKAYTSVLASEDGKQAGIYDQMATVCMNLDRLEEALGYAGKAVAVASTPAYKLTRAKIENALGKYSDALTDAEAGLAVSAIEWEAALESAIAEIGLGENTAALGHLNMSVMSAPAGVMEPIVVRAWMQNDVLKNTAAAQTDWQRVASSSPTTVKDRCYKGIAQSKSGKHLDASGTLKDAESRAVTPEDFYWLAVANMQVGDESHAKTLLEKAQNSGFENKYILNHGGRGNLSVAKLLKK